MIRIGCFFLKNVFNPAIYNDISEAILGVSSLLYDRGFELVKESTDADILWIDAERYASIGTKDKPVIIDEVTDVAQLYPATRSIIRNCTNLAGVTKPHVYRPRYRYGLQSPELYKMESEPCIDRWENMIYATIGYGALPRLEPLRQMELDPLAARPIDVFFAGTMEYSGFRPVEEHREKCCDAIEDACSKLGLRSEIIRGRKISTFDYWERMKRSKVCVSPWGWGAACHRDAEAFLCGCKLVKPKCGWIETWPDIYGRHVFECRNDWRYIRDVLKSTLEFCMSDSLFTARKEILRDTTPESIADRIASVLKQCATNAGILTEETINP